MVAPTFPNLLQDAERPAKKGTIVCDTSALRVFMVTLRQDKILSEGTRRTPLHSLLGALVFLAKQGYEVIIPEMVGHEMGGFMRDGKSYYLEYFESGGREFHKRMTYSSFFRKIVQLEAEGLPIHIQPPLPGNTSLEAQHVNAIYAIHHSDKPAHEKAPLLKALHQDGIERAEDAGDNEIIAYVQATHDSTTPLFILSNDFRLQHQFSHLPNVCALGAGGFLRAFNKSHLLPLCDLKPTSLKEYSAVLHKHSEHLLKHHDDLYYYDEDDDAVGASADEAAEKNRVQEDRVFRLSRASRGDAYSGDRWDYLKRPFAENMDALAKELHVVPRPPAQKAKMPSTMINQPHPQGIVLDKLDLSKVTRVTFRR